MQTPGQHFASASIPLRAADHLHPADILRRIDLGDRCVRYRFCISFLVATFRFESAAYLTDSWQMRYLCGWPYTLLSLALGIWGVPWGIFLVGETFWTNLCGGVDVTEQVRAQLLLRLPAGLVK